MSRKPARAAPRSARAIAQQLLPYSLAGRPVLITGRASEDWLGGMHRIAVGGLASHEATGGNSWRPTRRRPSGRDERGRFAGARH